jgi:hypothetical protein
MVETNVTIALRLAQQMATTKYPNTGQLQVDSPVAAAIVVQLWCAGQPESVDFLDMRAWDKDTTPGNQTDLVDVDSIGCALAGMSFLCSQGMSLDEIARRVIADPYLVLSSLYSSPDTMWNDFIAGMQNVWAGEASTNSPTPNDPFNVWGVQWPQPVGLAQQIYHLVVDEIARGIPATEIIAEIQVLLTPIPC